MEVGEEVSLTPTPQIPTHTLHRSIFTPELTVVRVEVATVLTQMASGLAASFLGEAALEARETMVVAVPTSQSRTVQVVVVVVPEVRVPQHRLLMAVEEGQERTAQSPVRPSPTLSGAPAVSRTQNSTPLRLMAQAVQVLRPIITSMAQLPRETVGSPALSLWGMSLIPEKFFGSTPLTLTRSNPEIPHGLI
jgi:hypothetical protein